MDIKVPLMYSCCIPVKGESRSIICDIQRQKYHFIPNSMYEVLTNYKGDSIAEIQNRYKNEYDEIIHEYFDFLHENEYIFFTDTPERFPEMDLHWEEPTELTNAIIDIGFNNSKINVKDIINQLSDLGCEHVQIRSFVGKPLSYFIELLNFIGTKRILSVELIIKYQIDFTIEELLSLCNKYPRVYSITVHTAPKTTLINSSSKGMGHVFLVEQKVDSSKHCGIISPEYFTINIKSFTESKKFNSCLNKKISIDSNGDIKNCPSMQESFGNILRTSLKKALNTNGFKKYWELTKDDITTCKQCEFRYICTDCRAFIEDPIDKVSKPLKCGYDPKTMEWQVWSISPLKRMSIEFYGLSEMLL